jgi:hypothetical protein
LQYCRCACVPASITSSMRILSYPCVQDTHTASCKCCHVSPQHTGIKGCPQSYVAPIGRTWDGNVCLLAAAVVLAIHGKVTAVSHADHAILHSEKVLLQKKSYECWLMGYHLLQPTHHPHFTHCAFNGHHVHATWEYSFLADNETLFRIYVDADIPSMQREDFYYKNHTLNAHMQIPH